MNTPNRKDVCCEVRHMYLYYITLMRFPAVSELTSNTFTVCLFIKKSNVIIFPFPFMGILIFPLLIHLALLKKSHRQLYQELIQNLLPN